MASRKDSDIWLINIMKLLIHEKGTLRFCEINGWVQKSARGRQSPNLSSLIKNNLGVMFLADQVSVESSNITITTKARLCAKHWTKEGCKGMICNELHICRFFIYQNCNKKSRCRFGHQFNTEHNLKVLQNHYLHTLSPEEIITLFKLVSKESTEDMCQATYAGGKKLDICRFYNKTNDNCKFKNGRGCPAMHICYHYISNDCSFGQNCKKSHNICDDQPKFILNRHGLDVSESPHLVLDKLKKLFQQGQHDKSSVLSSKVLAYEQKEPVQGNIGARPKQHPLPQGNNMHCDEIKKNSILILKICTYALAGKCNYGKNCRKVHSRKPYLWQYDSTSTDESSWSDFSAEDNDSIELCYQDVVNDYCYAEIGKARFTVKIDFDTMTFTGKNVALNGKLRRIGTDSWGAAPINRPYITKWLWYWKDEYNKWIEYGKQEATHQKSGVTSREIEEKFIDDDSVIFEFEAGKHSYMLDMKSMTQKNVKIGTKRIVRRRPLNVVYKQKEKENLDGGAHVKKADSKYQEIEYPKDWDMTAPSDDPSYQLVKVTESSREFYEIEELFAKTMAGTPITNIFRIQNFELWEDYFRKNEKMKKTKEDGIVKELRLFHGTRDKYVEAICQQGFDWRMTGSSVGTLYGKGSYFARDAKYSDSYTFGSGKMFVVKVLVGEYANGTSDTVRPPPKDPLMPLKNFYDSCVNDLTAPKIYVVFEKQQSYPEYVIEY